MPENKLTKLGKSIVKWVKSNLTWAQETISMYNQARKNNNISKDNIGQLAISKAKKNYSSKNEWREMTPSMLKNENESWFLSKSTREYLNDRDSIKEKLLKQYKLD